MVVVVMVMVIVTVILWWDLVGMVVIIMVMIVVVMTDHLGPVELGHSFVHAFLRLVLDQTCPVALDISEHHVSNPEHVPLEVLPGGGIGGGRAAVPVTCVDIAANRRRDRERGKRRGRRLGGCGRSSGVGGAVTCRHSSSEVASPMRVLRLYE